MVLFHVRLLGPQCDWPTWLPRRTCLVVCLSDAVLESHPPQAIKAQNPDVIVVVDNCYGEFTDVCEPPAVRMVLRCLLCRKNMRSIGASRAATCMN